MTYIHGFKPSVQFGANRSNGPLFGTGGNPPDQPKERTLSGGQVVSETRFQEVQSLLKALTVFQTQDPDRKGALAILWHMAQGRDASHLEEGSTPLKQLGLMGDDNTVSPETLAMVRDLILYDDATDTYSISLTRPQASFR